MESIPKSTNFDPYAKKAEPSPITDIGDSSIPSNKSAPEPILDKRVTTALKDMKAFAYGLNRVLSFVMLAAMSFIFYSSLAGSNLFFFWFNGIAGVVFDIKQVQLWDEGRRGLAWLFIAFSVFAFAGSSLMETQRQSIKVADQAYITSLENSITRYDTQIKEQQARVDKTPEGYGTAASKESTAMRQLIADQKAVQEELTKYRADHKSDASMSSFDIIAGAMNANPVVLVWVFFVIRAVLLEISVMYSSKIQFAPIIKHKNIIIEKEEYERYSPHLSTAMKSPVHEWLESWISAAQSQGRGGSLDRIKTLKNYIFSLEKVTEEELYVRKDRRVDKSDIAGV